MTIKEVSEKYGLSKDTLRYYEKEGLIGPVAKGKNNQREYQEEITHFKKEILKEENLNKIEFIKCMRSVNMPISKLKTYMNLYAQGPSTLDSRKEILESQLDSINMQLNDLKKAKERLIKKIEIYNQEQIKRDKEK